MLYHLFHYLLHGEHYAYENVLFRATCAAIFCFMLVVFLGPKFIRRLVALKLREQPEFDHAALNEVMRDKKNVPTMGGILILGALLSGVLLFADPLNFYIQIALVCLLWLGSLGAVDDWLKLTARGRAGTRDGLKMYEKLLFQIGLGVILGAFAFSFGKTNLANLGSFSEQPLIESFHILSVPFYKKGILLSPLMFMLVTVLVTTFTSNAVNLTDGMDGLASGCVAICAAAFAALTFVVGDEAAASKLLLPHIPRSGELAVLCAAIVGSCLGFLWHNCHPAKVFMGDTGSLPLGGLIGYVAIVTRQELMLFIVGGVFVIEALSVMLQVGYFKMTKGKRLFLVAPIHHHFHLSGWSETQVVVRFWLLGAMFAAGALVTVKLR